MGRIFFFLLLALAVYLGWRWMKVRQRVTHGQRSTTKQAQAMVSCATCGLHLPRQEALVKDERYYCCEEHRRSATPE